MSQHYFSYPAVSNSMLSAFERKIFNMYVPKLEHTYEFGSIAHQLILEPHRELLAPELVTETEMESIYEMCEAAKRNRQLSWLCQFSRKEVEVFWQDETTGLPLKSKLDISYKNLIISDLKTTSSKTEKAFRSSMIKFGYLRQAAYYLDSVQGKRFVFFAIQKHAPFNVFQVELTREEIATGRKQYRKLLDKAHQMKHFNF